MLSVDSLPDGFRTIYEAVRDAKRAIKPSELVKITGMKPGTVRGTVTEMAKRGYLRKAGYGLYFAVPLDQVGVREPDMAYLRQSKTPTEQIVYLDIDHGGVGGYSDRTNKQEEAKMLDPRTAASLIQNASRVEMEEPQFWAVQNAMVEHERYTLRLVLIREENSQAKQEEPPPTTR